MMRGAFRELPVGGESARLYVSGRRLFLLLALALVPGTAAAQSASWSSSLEAYAYLLQDDSFLLPIVRADRGALHLEGRFQYEDRETFSAWAGWSVGAGTTVRLEAVPMVGAIAGQTNGVAPGFEASLTWKSLELYAESEYVFDVESDEGDFFYNWSQLSWQAQPWLACGLSIQRTRMVRSELAIERGVFAAARRGSAELSVYGFNLDGDEPFLILGLGIEF